MAIYRPFARVVQLRKRVPAPPRTLGVSSVVVGFALLIVVGTLLLSLPMARVPGTSWNLLDSLFTATSAVCVVGLVVVDTGTHWSLFGQAVILALVQLGGLGVMTASMFILIILRRPVSFRDRVQLQETSRLGNIRSVSGLLWATVLVTIFFELAGTAAIWYHLKGLGGDVEHIWPAVFHAISAFNNAGFDVTGNLSSFTSFARDPIMLLIVAVLAIFGGLGALVLMDIVGHRSWRAFSQNSKLVLTISAVLLIVGFLGILAAEFANPKTLGALSLGDKATNALFHSVVARTSGFNTLMVKELHDETQLLTMALMYIGGATGSTAGGIKVTTLGVLVLASVAATRGYEHASAFGGRLSHQLIYRALAVAAYALAVVFLGTLLLAITEQFAFRELLFEVVSAFATVGLSTGITPDLSIAGKLTIIAVMYLGRLGPLTVAYALAQRSREPSYQLPERDVAIG
jgi:trk system potassium uptake protein TrkH